MRIRLSAVLRIRLSVVHCKCHRKLNKQFGEGIEDLSVGCRRSAGEGIEDSAVGCIEDSAVLRIRLY